jgi:3-oxoacyl-[acyl-carrier protein] reductase
MEKETPVMLISGTSRSIGRKLIEYYVNSGFQVIGFSRSEVDFKLERYIHHCVDITDESSIRRLFKTIRNDFGRLDVVINNAGIASMNHALLSSLSEIQNVMNTNFVGTVLCCREAVKLMKKKQYGRIVNISSIHVPLASVGTSVYGASKAATEQYSKVLAREVFGDGITVNILSLSVVEESGMANQISEKISCEITDCTVSKSRLGFHDVVNSINYLISKDSAMITSQKIDLGGI